MIFERFNKLTEERNSQMVTVISNPQETPEFLDTYKLSEFEGLFKTGELSTNNKVFIHYSGIIFDGNSGIVYTSSYRDRKSLQRRGIGTSFYQRLESILRQLEIKYLSGLILSPHPEFFERQRIHFRDLPEDVKSEFFSNLGTLIYHDKFMVKIL